MHRLPDARKLRTHWIPASSQKLETAALASILRDAGLTLFAPTLEFPTELVLTCRAVGIADWLDEGTRRWLLAMTVAYRALLPTGEYDYYVCDGRLRSLTDLLAYHYAGHLLLGTPSLEADASALAACHELDVRLVNQWFNIETWRNVLGIDGFSLPDCCPKYYPAEVVPPEPIEGFALLSLS